MPEWEHKILAANGSTRPKIFNREGKESTMAQAQAGGWELFQAVPRRVDGNNELIWLIFKRPKPGKS